ncbi:hypothetical protein Hanom_Chr03g00242581 [Helianthus anomalus]
MFTSNCRRYPLPLKLMSFVLNVSKSCTVCPFSLTQFFFFFFFVKSGYPGILVFLPYLFNIILKIK